MYKSTRYGIYILIFIIILLLYDFYSNYQTTPEVWNSEWFHIRIAMIVFTFCGFIIYYYFRRIQRSKRNQQEFTNKIILAQEEEWKQIASELHDSVGQNLTFVNNQILQLLNSMNGEGKKEELMNISKNVLSSVDEVRRIMSKLYPHQLERLGFKIAADSLIERARKSSKIIIDSNIEDIGSKIPFEYQVNIFRIIQEGLNNIIKHSDAERSVIDLYSDSSGIYLIIEDNGKGLDFKKTKSNSAESGRGLQLMNERAKMIRGKMTITSNKNWGTKISFKFPFK